MLNRANLKIQKEENQHPRLPGPIQLLIKTDRTRTQGGQQEAVPGEVQY